MNNYIQPGNVVDLTAPAGGVVGGMGYIIGGIFGVAVRDAAEGETVGFQGKTKRTPSNHSFQLLGA